jgi:hypothetical protein
MKLTTHLHIAPKLRMHGAIPPFPQRLHGVVLVKHRDDFTFAFTFTFYLPATLLKAENYGARNYDR